MSFGAVLRRRGFAALSSAYFVSRVGDSVHEIAVVWLVYEVTGRPSLVAATVIASTLPHVVLSLPAGAVVDRVDRRSVLVATQLVRGAAIAAIPLVGRGPLLVPVVIGAAAVNGAMGSLFLPARQALVPDVVSEGQLDTANSVMEIANNVSLLLYAAGGLIVGVAGSFAAFWLNVATFLLSACAALAVPAGVGGHGSDDHSPDDGGLAVFDGLFDDVRDGLATVRDDPVLPSVIAAVALINFATGPLGIVLAAFSDQVLAGGSVTYGYVYAALSAGIVVGGVVIGRLGGSVASVRGRLIVAGVLANGLFLGLAGSLPRFTTHGFVAAAVAVALAGVATSAVKIPIDSHVQSIVPADAVGKVFSVIAVLGNVIRPVGLAVAGPLLDAFPPDVVLVAQGLFVAAVGLALFTTPLATRSVAAADT